jgi:hypothetical protein
VGALKQNGSHRLFTAYGSVQQSSDFGIATDRLSAKLIQPCLAGLANGLGCLHISAQIAAVQTSDVGLSFMMSRRNLRRLTACRVFRARSSG